MNCLFIQILGNSFFNLHVPIFIPAQCRPSCSLSLNDRWTRNLDTGQPVDRQGTADTIISHDSFFKIVVIIV